MNQLRLIQGGRSDVAEGVADFSGVAGQVLIPASGDVPEICLDQVLRKQHSEDLLRAEGVAVDRHLPVVEGEAGLQLPTRAEVADRALALAIVGAKGAGIPQIEVERIIDERGAYGLFSPLEQDFIDDDEPSSDLRAWFAWRYEASWTLMWALRHFDGALGRPDRRCDSDRLMDTIFDIPDLARHRLRPANEILNEADLAYRYHMAARRAGLDGRPSPEGIDPEVARERHHALTWLTCHGDFDWDELIAAG
ncbi:DUF4272 domain-containing protein [Sphingomonas parva]|uniref:DUF4272 domain-containing protein n=1 Tax=Sphingomonas parva TaxID=2555898 RepID=A0A4Y8ZU08_9SPHN|nr:DUF4272 domain-containing protein [Sphingomonas parva]TFI59490.1 DUF4272 domain-containing protein [Sphingomonas parva]